MHDAHCHIDLYRSYREELAAIAQSRQSTIAVTNAPSVFDAMVRLASGNPFVYPAIGLHPELAEEREHELALLLGRLDNVRFVGEIGLDYSNRSANRAQQRKIFSRILSGCAAYPGKVLSIHSRNAGPDAVELVGDRFPGAAVLHWFSGTQKVLERALSFGFYFSVNPAMIRSERGRAIVSALPRERVLTESDGPFVDVGGVPARPADVKLVVEYLAKLWLMPTDQVERAIDQTFAKITGTDANKRSV